MVFVALVVLGSMLAVGSLITIIVHRHGNQSEEAFTIPRRHPR